MKSIDIIIFLFLSAMMLLMSIAALTDHQYSWALTFVVLSLICLFAAIITADIHREKN